MHLPMNTMQLVNIFGGIIYTAHQKKKDYNTVDWHLNKL